MDGREREEIDKRVRGVSVKRANVRIVDRGSAGCCGWTE